MKGPCLLKPNTSLDGVSHSPPGPSAVAYLQVGLVLDEFLSPAVEQANMGVTLLHRLAAQLQHQPQDPMSRRVLRPKVNHIVGDVAIPRRVFVCWPESGGDKGRGGDEQ